MERYGIKGFTLVELAVAMIIIGLLLGGVLKGQKLIESSKITRTIQTSEAYLAAHYGFYDKYRGYAGDLVSARSKIPNCSGVCENGNGNSIIGQGTSTVSNYFRSDRTENLQYWKHLVLADFITGVDPLADVSGTSGWTTTNPSSPIGGGFHVIHMSNPRYTDLPPGVIFVLTDQLEEGPNTESAFIPPDIAYSIDKKMDDGRPNTGIVRAEYVSTDCDNDATNEYKLEAAQGRCFLMFTTL